MAKCYPNQSSIIKLINSKYLTTNVYVNMGHHEIETCCKENHRPPVSLVINVY